MIGEAKLKGEFDKLAPSLKEWSEEHDIYDRERVEYKIREMVMEGKKSPFVIADKLYRAALRVHPVSEYHADWFYEVAKEVLKEIE
jgi:hypothetical protein